MAGVAHEIAQNNLAVVYFSTMLPPQLLVNTAVLGWFESVRFLCLTCDAATLRGRFGRRFGSGNDSERIEAAVERWRRFDDALTVAARSTVNALTIDASRSIGEVERDVRTWILAGLRGGP